MSKSRRSVAVGPCVEYQRLGDAVIVAIFLACLVASARAARADGAAPCVEAKDGTFHCSKPGKYVWRRPPGVRWIQVEGVGGGGGGASGEYGTDPCRPGGGGGEGAAVSVRVVGPLDKDSYDVYIGAGGVGGPSSDSKHPPIQSPGARGEDTRIDRIAVFPGGEGGTLGHGGRSGRGAAGGDSEAGKSGYNGAGSAAGGAGGTGGHAENHDDAGKTFPPGGGGGGGGGSLGVGGDGGWSHGFKYDGEPGKAGSSGAGGGGGGGICWMEGNRPGPGGNGGNGRIVILPSKPKQ